MRTADQVIAATYKRFPIVLERGRGCTVWDTRGQRYTDFVSPALPSATWDMPTRALPMRWHGRPSGWCMCPILYYTIPQTELARMLVETQLCRPCLFRQLRCRGQRGRHQTGPKIF
jgi:acetylornithine/N-succinyldiaminopimelate aminotransferase